jgi:cadmium resistance protein CadD (predicted permease)
MTGWFLPATTGLAADVGIAVAAFVGTNIDNTVVTMGLVAGAPVERARRIAAGQVIGFAAIVLVAAAAAVALFEFTPKVVGLLGLVPLAIGVRGLVGLRSSATRTEDRERVARRAVGRSLTAAALVTIGASGDNLAAYIPLFRVGGAGNVIAIVLVFAAGEVGVTALVLAGGRHPRVRSAMSRLGAVAVPLLLCAIGVLVMVEAGTLALL